jgi:hypothetical protein
VLRITDQSAASVAKAVADLATLTDPDSLAGRWRSCSADYCASATHDFSNDFESSQLGVPASDK